MANWLIPLQQQHGNQWQTNLPLISTEGKGFEDSKWTKSAIQRPNRALVTP